MKKVRILWPIVGRFAEKDYAFTAFEILELPDELADDLIRGKHAELVAEPPSAKAENAQSKLAKKAEKR